MTVKRKFFRFLQFFTTRRIDTSTELISRHDDRRADGPPATAVNAVGDNVASMMVARILGGRDWMNKAA